MDLIRASPKDEEHIRDNLLCIGLCEFVLNDIPYDRPDVSRIFFYDAAKRRLIAILYGFNELVIQRYNVRHPVTTS